LLHTPRAPFYSPKVARSCWSSIWKAIVAFYPWVHRTVNNTRTGRNKESPDWLVSTSGGHQIVRCACRPLASVDVVTSHCAAGAPDCLAPRANCPMNFSRHRLKNPRAASLARPCTELSDAHRTVRWVALDRPVLRSPTVFPYFFLCLLLFLWDLT
jgi:hypothetical protein